MKTKDNLKVEILESVKEMNENQENFLPAREFSAIKKTFIHHENFLQSIEFSPIK